MLNYLVASPFENHYTDAEGPYPSRLDFKNFFGPMSPNIKYLIQKEEFLFDETPRKKLCDIKRKGC